jgi:hypothetical protein
MPRASNALSGATPAQSEIRAAIVADERVPLASVGNRHTLSFALCVKEWDYAFDPQKNAWLIRERGISFEQVIALIESSKLVQVLEHPNAERYPNQLLYEVDVGVDPVWWTVCRLGGLRLLEHLCLVSDWG